MDANVLVAAFLRFATTRELLLDERLLLSSPEWSLIETEGVLTTLQFRRRFGGLPTAEVRTVLRQITSNILIIPAAVYRRSLVDAERLTPDPAPCLLNACRRKPSPNGMEISPNTSSSLATQYRRARGNSTLR